MIIYVGLDDTDNHESRGTGRLAREIAHNLAADFTVQGVTRHQLLVDPRVPYTSHNSSAAIGLKCEETCDLPALFERVQALMLADFIPGSDPGLCVAAAPTARTLTTFGRRAQNELVTQAEARALAQQHGILLAGLGGSQDGVIGALSAVGLASCGEDGRYLLLGSTRDLSGLQEIPAVLSAGIAAICTADGAAVEQGKVLADKLRPARRSGQAILFVEWQEDHWLPLKLD